MSVIFSKIPFEERDKESFSFSKTKSSGVVSLGFIRESIMLAFCLDDDTGAKNSEIWFTTPLRFSLSSKPSRSKL